MEGREKTYTKGELVPGPGTYRCGICGEIWTTSDSNVRFPPCDAAKDGKSSWIRVEETSRPA